MPGKTLRCDHDGCRAEFPPAPIAGRYWPIRAEAEKAGWKSTRSGLYNVDDDSDHQIRDFCPAHVYDLTALRTRKWKQRVDEMHEAGGDVLYITRTEYLELQDLARQIMDDRARRHAESLMSTGIEPPLEQLDPEPVGVSAMFGTPRSLSDDEGSAS
jgi:hypothetical protein